MNWHQRLEAIVLSRGYIKDSQGHFHKESIEAYDKRVLEGMDTEAKLEDMAYEDYIAKHYKPYHPKGDIPTPPLSIQDRLYNQANKRDLLEHFGHGSLISQRGNR